MSRLRLGLTMRVVGTPKYIEFRDAIATGDWAVFMRKVLPHDLWLPMPNIGEDIIPFIRDWNLSGFIITGGNNLFDRPERDKTELAILTYAIENNLPVFGICRGFQIMAHYFDYEIKPCKTRKHAATRHEITLYDLPFDWNEQRITVNSFHDNCGPDYKTFSRPIVPFAIDPDGCVEGFYHQHKALMAIMWHPEREKMVSNFDSYLLRYYFKN
jgi:N5-(cytidine 5'-diphosphoramidyl)-L-glutamine hydrolase